MRENYKIYPWSEFEYVEPEDYRWDCIDTEITELPDVISWCQTGSFGEPAILHRINFGMSGSIHSIRNFSSVSSMTSNITDVDLQYFLGFSSQANISTTMSNPEWFKGRCIEFVDVSNWGTITYGSWTGTDWQSENIAGVHRINLGDPTGFEEDFRPLRALFTPTNNVSSVRVSMYNGYNNTLVDNVTIVPGEEIPITYLGGTPPVAQPYDIDRIEFESSRISSSTWIQSTGVSGFELTGDFTIDVRSWREVISQGSGDSIYTHAHWFWVVNTVTGNGVRMGLSEYLNNGDSWYVERTAGGIPATSTSSYQRVSNGSYDNIPNRLKRTGDNVQAYWRTTFTALGGAKFIGPDPCVVVLGTRNSMPNGTIVSNSFDSLNLVAGTYNGVNPNDSFTTLDLTKWEKGNQGGNPNNDTFIQSGRMWAYTEINVGQFNIVEMQMCGPEERSFASQADIVSNISDPAKGMTKTSTSITNNGSFSTAVYHDTNLPLGNISFRSSTRGTTQCALPAGTQDGDLLIWINGYPGIASPGVPAGFTSIHLLEVATWQRAAYKIASGETGPYSSTNTFAAHLYCITKTSGTWVPPTTAGLNSIVGIGSSFSLTTDPVTPLNSQDLLIVGFSNDGGRPIVAEPAGDLITISPQTRTMRYDTLDDIVGSAIVISTGA